MRGIWFRPGGMGLTLGGRDVGCPSGGRMNCAESAIGGSMFGGRAG